MRRLCLVLVLMLHLSWGFSSTVPPPSSPLCLPHQRAALLQFKNSISITEFCPDDSYAEHPKTEAWNKSIDCCSWDGVVCDELTGHVIGIDLSSSCLTGSLLANNSLFRLHTLQWLDLNYNDLHGSPLENTSSLFHFHGLRRLNLAYNNFDGTIPSELFSQLVSLTHLNLSFSGFSGIIPHQISLLSSLVSLDLSHYSEDLTTLTFDGHGFDMLPRNLTKLRYLVLDNVVMPDVALTSFINLSSSLQRLSLYDCQLHGEFPSQLFHLPNLKHIDLGGNENLTVYLPKTNWSSGLESLDISDGGGFRGSIPSSVGNLTQLISIDLSGNWFEGQIPDVFGNLNRLTSLRFSSCNLSGPLPITMSNLTKLTTLDLSYNYFHGPLPDYIFDLVSLTALRLSSNNLSGVVKSDMLSKLTSLEFLDLSSNSLLSLSTSGKDVNHSFPRLATVLFSSCSVRQFPSFFQTSKLEYLDLSNNMISGGVSKREAEGWEALRELYLFNNSLTSFEQFPGQSLLILDLRFNLLEGPILSTCLNLRTPNQQLFRVFLISENKLTGNIPSSICTWSSLTLLDLSRNNLSGTIPECLGNFSHDLQLIDLQMNNLTGKIPNSFANNELSHLFLNDNQLEGLVPPSLANSTKLKILNLGNNKLIGRFPYWLTSLPSLQVLILRHNRLHGSLLRSIASSNFSSLQLIDLSGNEFSGPLPTKLFQNLRAMREKPKWRSSYLSFFQYQGGEFSTGYYQTSVNVTTKSLEIELMKTATIFVCVDLSNNRFSGQIPEEVGQLLALQMLNFSHNNFNGPIPASFENLAALESLDLSSNKLGGRIPSQMSKLTFLAVLNLSENNLVGPIPHGNQFNTFDSDSYIGNLGLCGLPLSKQCNNHGEVEPTAPSVAEHEDSQVPFWQVVMMGYGSGVVLGLSLGYIVFTTGRPWWLVRMVERDLQYKFTAWIRRKKPKRN
ncbi:receptor like protein 7 [Hibiscus trionum]|uniref:Receptor like protein 7 n=1 Tax=Hibiscus trionum TaxID=183268 RepID=A0A9W7HBW8_HIBTR|nr:receptor like protein 7 [Hibiscus trionum]